MKKILVTTLGIFGVLGVALQSQAAVVSGDILFGNSWGISFTTEYRPTVINFWSSGPQFEFVSSALPSGYTSQISSDGLFMQLATTGTPGSNFTSAMWWYGEVADVKIDWQEVIYDWSTGVVAGYHQGSISHDGYGRWTKGDCSRPPVPSVPEPSTMLLLGSGLFGLVVRRRRSPKM